MKVSKILSQKLVEIVGRKSGSMLKNWKNETLINQMDINNIYLTFEPQNNRTYILFNCTWNTHQGRPNLCEKKIF